MIKIKKTLFGKHTAKKVSRTPNCNFGRVYEKVSC